MINLSESTKKFGLLGYPIDGSLSPLIHNYLFKENGENAVYLSLPLEDETDFEKVIVSLKDLGFQGLNLTLPYKREVLPFLDFIDETAKDIGAVNTVKYKDGKIEGYNTDVYGFLKPLEESSFCLEGESVLVFGAGGASNAVLYSLLKEQIGQIYLYNRTISKAYDLKKFFADDRIHVIENVDEILEKKEISLLVNTTSVGNYPDVESSILTKEELSNFENAFVYDIVYKPETTLLLSFAQELGLKTLNGLPMLLHQALKAEEIWFEKKIDSKNIIKILNI